MNHTQAQNKAIHARSVVAKVGKEIGKDKFKTNPFAKKYKEKLENNKK